MPGNAHFLFMQIYNLASFNILNVDVITGWFSDLLHLDRNPDKISSRLQAMGFQSPNVIINLGLVFIFILVFMVVVLATLFIHLLVKFSCRCQEKLRRFNETIKKKLYWNFLIRFFTETYLDQAFVQALKLINI